MARGVRPVDHDGIHRLTDAQLDAYIADTKRRIAAMSKATLRNSYRDQLRTAELIKRERTTA